MKYVEVLPLTKTGDEDQAFTYEAGDSIQPGSLVQIPLRNRVVRGLVTEVVAEPDFNTRPITKILTDEPVLNEVQLKIAKKIAEYYLAPLGSTINSILSFDFGKKRRNSSDKGQGTRDKEEPLKLTEEQEKAFNDIKESKPGSKHLLFGVTGSGKTEIYLQLIAEALKRNQGAIVLVPEISLTPQTVARFENRFGNKVAVWHSGMKETEKFRAWNQLKSGEKMIVVGARSAVFAPIKNLAYIVIDEEHESSYKQDQTPRYEASKVAEWLAELTGAKLVLGSATPRIESYRKTEEGHYNLSLLSKRIVQESMPPVAIIDLRDEFRKGNKSIFSDELLKAITDTLQRKKQVMLFVNRRGASTFVVCRDCGYVSECPKCEIPLTYHPSEGQVLKCHHCNHKSVVPTTCPNCQSFAIRYFGLGTQRVELEAKKLFPKAKVARMDRDTTQKRGSHEEIYEGFKNQDFDILIGTQLIAKGWDLPNVELVGVISADTSLNLPDFRASEKTFSLLTQVAGRTGRGYHPGEVVVQTYAPENYAIQAAKEHDYLSFYKKEVSERQKYSYPPYSGLIKLTYSGINNEKCENASKELAKTLQESLGSEQVELLGPSQAFIAKQGDKYRWQIVVKATCDKQHATRDLEIIKLTSKIKPLLKQGWATDVNPENLL